MSYESIDTVQNVLANTVFAHTQSQKKAAGRALGTFVEIIAYYLIQAWGYEHNVAIEKPLPEYANADISHNVEFTLHGSVLLQQILVPDDMIIIKKKFFREKLSHNIITDNELEWKTAELLDKHIRVKNSCILLNGKKYFVVAYYDTVNAMISVCKLHRVPFAMFECKRVGVEEGNRKGPQTIEKAKQGSYVANSVSCLQKLRASNGDKLGVIEIDGEYVVDEYDELLVKIINQDNQNWLKNFILTVGVVSNHGNWFTQDNHNKELKVLAQSYDWLLFLTDVGMTDFIRDLLSPETLYPNVREAFLNSYSENKICTFFTKTRMSKSADQEIRKYFCESISKIESWFNIITPKNKTIKTLKDEIQLLTQKKWEEIYK